MIVNANASICAALGVRPWYTYVRSKANWADLPSRFAIRELLELLERLDLLRYLEWMDPVMPDLSEWRSSASMWLERLGAQEPEQSLASLRGRWRHMVAGEPREAGATYVGRNPQFGATRYGIGTTRPRSRGRRGTWTQSTSGAC